MHKIPFDATLLLQQITLPYNLAGLIHAGQQLGLKINTQPAKVKQLTTLPLPCLPIIDGKIEPTLSDTAVSPTDSSSDEPNLGMVLILRADQDRVHYTSQAIRTSQHHPAGQGRCKVTIYAISLPMA